MLVETEVKQVSLFLVDDHGNRFRKQFSEMPIEVARQLVREYGYKPSWVEAALIETFTYTVEIDDDRVKMAMETLPYQEWFTKADLLTIVRTIVPNAKRILRTKLL